MPTDTRQPAARYKPDATFACVRRQFDPATGGAGEACGAEIRIHGYWWCAQVCPVCLATYYCGGSTKDELFLDHGWFDPPTAVRVRANIAANGGQYVPEFNR